MTNATSLLLGLAVLLLTGCQNASVHGRVQDTNESFHGTATGYFTGHGRLRVVSSKGATCTGRFRYIEDGRGLGKFTCEDGRGGPFEFTSSGTVGAGYGYLGDDLMTFEFGQ
jgi:hypothetical protein